MRGSQIKIRNKGGGFIFFVAVIIPAAFFALAISIDHGRVILANRVAADIADTLALSAAGARIDDGDKFDVQTSKQYTKDTYNMIVDQGVIPKYIYIDFNENSYLNFNSEENYLTITVNWRVDSLPFIKLITGNGNETIAGSVRRSAKICIAESSKTPCSYPL
jgi:Flp pilus assembly protein TadG